jgi:hypothetical protein
MEDYKDQLVAFDDPEGAPSFNAEVTWINMVEAVELGCEPKEVAEAIVEMLDAEQLNELADNAPVGAWSNPVVYNSPTARLCWSLIQANNNDHRWAPKIAPPAEVDAVALHNERVARQISQIGAALRSFGEIMEEGDSQQIDTILSRLRIYAPPSETG